MGLILLILLLLLVFGGLPQAGFFHHNMGYAPSGLLGIVLVVILILMLAGRL